MLVTELDIFKAATGQTEGESNSAVKIGNYLLDINSDEKKEVSEITLDNPYVNIFRNDTYTMIDLVFSDDVDYDLHQVNKMLKDFCVVENSVDEEADIVPLTELTICPKEYLGEYFITAVNGAWCLMPSVPGEAINTVRFMFANNLVHTYKLKTSEIDYDALEAEINLENNGF